MKNRKRPAGDQTEIESICFERTRQACQENDPDQAITNLLVWIGVICQTSQNGSINPFIGDVGEGRLIEEIKLLREARLSKSPHWSGARLFDALSGARDRLLRRKSPGRAGRAGLDQPQKEN